MYFDFVRDKMDLKINCSDTELHNSIFISGDKNNATALLFKFLMDLKSIRSQLIIENSREQLKLEG